jgi:hypothetical protein
MYTVFSYIFTRDCFQVICPAKIQMCTLCLESTLEEALLNMLKRIATHESRGTNVAHKMILLKTDWKFCIWNQICRIERVCYKEIRFATWHMYCHHQVASQWTCLMARSEVQSCRNPHNTKSFKFISVHWTCLILPMLLSHGAANEMCHDRSSQLNGVCLFLLAKKIMYGPAANTWLYSPSQY